MTSINSAIAILLTLSLIYCGEDSDEPTRTTAGNAAPDFTLVDSRGTEHKLSDYKGKFVVLEWINFDCPYVRKHYESGNMQSLQKEFTQKGVVWLAINSSAEGKQGHFSRDEIQRRSEEHGANFTAYLLDEKGTVGRSYGAKATPHMYIINPEGTLIYSGAIDDKPTSNLKDIEGATNYVRQALNAAMNGKPVEKSRTRAYGCAVKYSDG
ncbi:MAG TPA: thioredoxin family protein [Leptospiraceae bacterium]|nr:thioredoxin family protein [Spirochaetaceae bacterium]HBS04361.1 thioredoxin family protein [Leptospiraceae bacterium]|tara:strand:+ start:16932 stop:17561 length:630 start_codon:yes stop_codon:yes gene_type:complete